MYKEITFVGAKTSKSSFSPKRICQIGCLVLGIVQSPPVSSQTSQDTLGYRRLNIDEMFYRGVSLMATPRYAKFRIDEQVGRVVGGKPKGYLFLFGNFGVSLYDESGWSVYAHASVLTEGVIKGKREIGTQNTSLESSVVGGPKQQTTGLAQVSVSSPFGAVFVGAKADEASERSALTATVNLDKLFFGANAVRSFQSGAFDQLLQIGPRINADKIALIPTTYKPWVGVFAFNYQRLGVAFQNVSVDARTLLDLIYLDAALDISNGQLRSFIGGFNFMGPANLPSQPKAVDGEPPSQGKKYGDEYYGPIVSYFTPPEPGLPSRWGYGVLLRHVFTSGALGAAAEMSIRKNYVDDIRQQAFLTGAWLLGVKMVVTM